jgi:hypothetical protein
MFTPEEQSGVRYNAALELLRYKMLKAIEKNKSNYATELKVEELNDILLVGGLPIVVPDEVKVKEVDVIAFNKEDN